MSKKVPMRTCMGCRISKPKEELLRIARSGDNICVDTSGTIAGRGAYVCPDEKCHALLRKSTRLKREFKMAINDETYDQLEKSGKIFQIIGLASRARRLVSGSEMCEREIKQGRVCLCIVAKDASDNTKKKFSDMCGYRNIEIMFIGDRRTLGKFTGKSERTVVAITDRGFADKLKELAGVCAIG